VVVAVAVDADVEVAIAVAVAVPPVVVVVAGDRRYLIRESRYSFFIDLSLGGLALKQYLTMSCRSLLKTPLLDQEVVVVFASLPI
jgi:hypothetical protein